MVDRIGLGQAIEELDVDLETVVAAVRRAPGTRPGRYTVLDEADLSDAALRSIVAEVLA